MNDEEVRFLGYFRAARFVPSTAGKAVTVPVSNFRGWKDGKAQSLASRWGYVYRGRNNAGTVTWLFQRDDAPEQDVVGGPSRKIARKVPAARAEAEKVREETGFDVFDAHTCLEVERAAGETAKKSQKPIIGVVFSWIPAVFCLGGAIYLASEGASASDEVTGLTVMSVLAVCLVALGLHFLRKNRATMRLYREVHAPKVALIKRVLTVAEDELLKAGRPT
ncbi:hypothetical protein [Streptomyces sp. WMMB 322]|uniref:hypothetical protein n=1 Tax=Streptomyces sp. WMMB 322 TaxID=1286821 RepID=UPI0011131FA2|nr:hypothetical protein [Streptomyces sp. WMMB 322]